MAVWEVVLSGVYYLQVWQNKLHFESGEGGMDAQTVANLIDLKWVEEIRQPQVADVFYQAIIVTRKDGGLLEQFTKPIAKQGAQAAETQSASFIAGVIQKKTGQAGRSKRGRVFVPGTRQGGRFLNQFTSGELALWNVRCANLKAAFIDPAPDNLRLIIKHPEGFTAVTDLNMRPHLGVMRSRNTFVGS